MRAHVISTVVIFPLLVTLCFVPLALGKQTDPVAAKLEGTIFVTDSEGKQSFVPGATVKLTGPVTCETQSDENGGYALAGLPYLEYQAKWRVGEGGRRRQEGRGGQPEE